MDELAAPVASSGSAAPAGSEFGMSSCNHAATGSDVSDIEGKTNSQAIGEQPDADTGDCVPASLITVNTMQQLLKRPFADVLKEITATLQLKSTTYLAAEQLRYLLHHDSLHHAEVIASPVISLLVSLVRESPGLPASGSAMAVLAMLALTPQGRAALRAEQTALPVLKFLSIKGILQKPNAEPALMLLQNISCDKLTRQALHKTDAIRAVLDILLSNAGWLKLQPKLSGPIAGFLSNLVVADGDNTASKQAFVISGGIEAVCQVLAEWGRYDRAPATQRLQLLMNEVAATAQYTMRVHELAGGNVLVASGGQSSGSKSGNTAVNSTSGARGLLGKGVPLGTPRMPASDRITTEVLKHTPCSEEPVEES